MAVKVTAAVNGYVLQPEGESCSEDGFIAAPIVVEEKPEDFGCEKGNLPQVRTAQSMLFTLLEELGYTDSKHDAYRLRITIENHDGEKVDYDGNVEPKDDED